MTARATRRRHRQEGSTLILTMIVLAGLAATLAALSTSEHIAAQEQINRMERARAKQAYMDGIQNAMAILSQIVEPGGQSSNSGSLTATNMSATSNNGNTTGATMLSDDWSQEGQNGAVQYHVGSHAFRMQIVDACSLININCTTSSAAAASITTGCNTAGTNVSVNAAQPIGASDALLNNLPFEPQEVQAIEDYRSTSTTQQPMGAKDPYYQGLQSSYNAKELPFETVDELLQVQGITAHNLYYPRTDVSTASNPLVDTNGNPEALSQVLTAYSFSPQATPTGRNKTVIGATTATPTSRRTGTAPGARGITISRPLSANTFTALGISQSTAQRLATAPANGWQSLGQVINTARASSSDCEAILNNLCIAAGTTVPQPQSSTGTTSGTPNFPVVNGLVNINTAPASVLEQLPGMTSSIATSIVAQQASGFLHVGDIMTVGGVTSSNIAQFADQITATSQTFIVRLIGTAGSTSIPVEAVISVTNDTPQIISIQEMPFPVKEMINRWTWDDNTTTDTVLKDNS